MSCSETSRVRGQPRVTKRGQPDARVGKRHHRNGYYRTRSKKQEYYRGKRQLVRYYRGKSIVEARSKIQKTREQTSENPPSVSYGNGFV